MLPCCAHQLFQRVIDVGGVSRAIARHAIHPVAVVIGVVEGFSTGPHLLADVAARIMREHPEARTILRHVGHAVGVRRIPLHARRRHGIQRVDVVGAVAGGVIGKRRLAPGPIRRGQTVQRAVPQGNVLRCSNRIRDRGQVHAVSIAISLALLNCGSILPLR